MPTQRQNCWEQTVMKRMQTHSVMMERPVAIPERLLGLVFSWICWNMRNHFWEVEGTQTSFCLCHILFLA